MIDFVLEYFTDELLAVGKQCGRSTGVYEHNVFIALEPTLADVVN